MSGFHEVEFPLALGLGARGGPERRTEIIATGSGQEVRNARWAHARRRYDVGGAVRTLSDLHTLISFFEARRGRLYGFRFRDFMDWRSCAPGETAGPLDQILAQGDGATKAFQLVKAYGGPTNTYLRRISKPHAGSVRIAVNGVELAESAFTVNPSTGGVTFPTAPASGATISAGFAFDTPVRFDIDRIEASLEGFGAGRIVSAPLVEVFV